MIAEVLVQISARSIDKVFDYLIPVTLKDKLSIGKRVVVPFGKQTLEGFILNIKEHSNEELKEIIEVVDEEIVLNKELLELGKYIQEITLTNLINCYQVMLPKALKAKYGSNINKKYQTYVVLSNETTNSKLNPKQQEIINILTENKKVLKSELKEISLSSLTTLEKRGIIKYVKEEVYRYQSTIEQKKMHKLTTDQEQVKNQVLCSFDKQETFLLHGVTGSGKTEVYMELIEESLKQNKTSILLVPEITLTTQMINRFQSRFGDNIAVLHSGLSDGEKYDEWRKINKEEVKIVIGARSAIFAPLNNIGIIIIDEMHTTSYKQDNNPKYDAIDIAIKRSEYHQCPVLLGSATPTLEAYARTTRNIYTLLELKQRVNQKAMPKVDVVNMEEEVKKGNFLFSTKLREEIEKRIVKNEQVILLLNRRGYSSFVSCKNCGETEKCPNCDISLTYHKTSNMLRCHYCGYAKKLVTTCSSCHEEAITTLGTGTQKVEEEIISTFPDAKVVRMDYDTTSAKGSHEKIIKAFQNREYNILLGTQMVAKGLDFEYVTLVGVINADTSLNIPDFRSSEYTFQLLDQVSGRSGRKDLEGEVIIQTFNPDNYAIEYAKNHDYLGFYQEEMNIRRQLKYSPYYYLTYIKIMSQDYDLASKTSVEVKRKLEQNLKSSIILGPSTCNVFRLKNTYRFGIIIKYKKEDNLYNTLKEISNHYKINNKITIDIDFNPNQL